MARQNAMNVGVPLDVQGKKYTGIYPSMGPGEPLAQKISGFVLISALRSMRVGSTTTIERWQGSVSRARF